MWDEMVCVCCVGSYDVRVCSVIIIGLVVDCWCCHEKVNLCTERKSLITHSRKLQVIEN